MINNISGILCHIVCTTRFFNGRINSRVVQLVFHGILCNLHSLTGIH